MKPTLRSALGFAVACLVGVATSGCRVVRRTLRQTALLAVLCAAPIWAEVVYQNGTAALNVNFAVTGDAALVADTSYGLVPFVGSQWNTVAGSSSNNLSEQTPLPLTDSAGMTGATIKVKSRGFGSLEKSSTYPLFVSGAIDSWDGDQPESVLTVEGIKYARYDVYIYMLGSAYDKLSPVRVNDSSVYYTMPADKECATISSAAVRWGSSSASPNAPVLGVNVMRIADIPGDAVNGSTLTLAAKQWTVSPESRANFAAIQIVERVAMPTYEATLAANASVAATELDVTLSSDGTPKKLSEMTAEDLVSITLKGNVTVSGAVTAKHLQTTGTGTLTFSEGTLSATSAWVDADVDVSDTAPNASLGAVSIAAGKTLTVGASGEPYTTLTAGSAISTVSPVSKLTIKATNENFEATPSQLAQLRAFTGVVEFTGTSGSNATGATLTYGSISDGYDNGFKPRFVFNKGQHTLAYGFGWTAAAAGNVRWSEGATDAAPTIEVTGGAQLTFKVKDVSGWAGSTGGKPSVLRVGEDSQLILTTLSKDGNGYSNATGYWRDRIVLDRGATVSVEAFTTSGGANNFVLYGDVGNSDLPQLAMLDNQGEAIWNGGFRTDKSESRISIGTNSSLLLNGAITGGKAISKVGAGRLTLTGTNTNRENLIIAEGTVRFAAAKGSATVGSWAGTVKVNAGATLEVPETAALPTLATDSAGTVLLTGNGELDVRSAIATASALKAGFAEGSTGMLIVPAGSEAANLQVPAGATLKLVLSAAQLAAGRYTYSFTQAEGSTVSFWRADAEGNLTEVTGTTEGSTFRPTLSFVFTNETGNGQWTDEGNWSNDEVPSATDAVEIPANTALTLTANVSVASLRVTGSGTLTVTGGTLTVTNHLLVVGQLAVTSSQLAFGDNLVAIDLPEAESALDYTVTSVVALPALTGTGTFTKRGTADMTFKEATTSYLAQVVVAEGILDTGDGEKSGEFHITVEERATFLTKWDTSLTSTASTLCLKGGAILDLRNGNMNAVRQFQTAITVDATAENPAIIQGSLYGNGSNLQGAITGKGTLEIRKAPDQTTANAFTISGSISDASAEERLALKVTQTGKDPAVTLTGDNTYTGGTTIASGATVKVDAPGKFGDGEVNIAAGGVVEFYQPGNDAVDHRTESYSQVKGEGTVRFTGSSWRALPSNAANIWASTLAVENNVQEGLVLVDKTNAYKIGTLSGSGCFWADGDTSGVATLEVIQRADATFSGYFRKQGDDSSRIPALKVLGESTGILTLSGDSKNTSPATLTIEKGASVVLTKAWAGPVTVNGSLAIGTAEATASVTLPQAVTEGATGQIDLPEGSTLTLSAASTLSGSLTGTGTLTIGNTLTLLPSGTMNIPGAISGTGAVNIGDGTTASTVKFSGACSYTGTTTIAEKATLLLGKGSDNLSASATAKIVVNGRLQSAVSEASYYRPTEGSGEIYVPSGTSLIIGQMEETVAEDGSGKTGLTGFTGTLKIAGTFEPRNWSSNAAPAYTYTISGCDVVFEGDRAKIKTPKNGAALVEIAADKKVSGGATMGVPLAFKANAVIEIGSVGIQLDAVTLTMPTGEGKKVLVKAAKGSSGFLAVPTASAPADMSGFDFAEGSALTAENACFNRVLSPWDAGATTYLQVLPKPTVSTSTAGVAEAILAQTIANPAMGNIPQPIASVKVADDKRMVPEGALFFENVVKTEMKSAETGISYTATVTYDFGVSAITVKKLTLAGAGTPELCVVVCAKVESSAITGTPAIFKDSAQVQLLLDDKVCDGTAGNGPLAYALTSAIDSTVDDSDKSVRWFAVPLGSLPTTGTSNFTVKVTESTP